MNGFKKTSKCVFAAAPRKSEHERNASDCGNNLLFLTMARAATRGFYSSSLTTLRSYRCNSISHEDRNRFWGKSMNNKPSRN